MVSTTTRGAMVPDLPARTPSAPRIDIQTAPNAGAPFAEAHDQFARIGERMDQRLDQVAEKEGEQAGGLAGLDAKFRPTGDATIRGMAYDAAGLRVTLSRFETDAAAQADSIFQQHKDDPAALKSAFADAQASSLAQLDGGLEQIKPDVALTWQRFSQAKLSDAALLAERRMADAQRAAASDVIDARLKRIEQLSYSSLNNKNAGAMIAEEMSGLQDLLVTYGPRGEFAYGGKTYAADPTRAGVLDATDIQKTLQDATERAGVGRVLGKFELTTSLAGKTALRKQLTTDYEAGKLPLSLDQFERIGNMMDSDIRSARAEANASAAAFNSEVATQLQLLEGGFAPTADLSKLSLQARAAGKPQLADRIQAAQGLFDFQNNAKRFAPAELDQWISAERTRGDKDGWTPYTASRFKLAEKIRDNMLDGLKSDPLNWAADNGQRPLAPIDFRNPQTLTRRFSDAEAVAKEYGTPVRYFTNAERTSLAAAMESAPPEQKMALLGKIAAAAPNDRLPRIMGELSVDQPAMAQAGLLLHDGNASAASRVAAGTALIKAKAADAPPPSKTAPIAAPVLSALPPGLATARGAIKSAADAIYATEASRAGITEFDEDLYARALNEAAGARFDGNGNRISGGFDRVNGANVLLPSKLSADDVERALSKLDDGDLSAAGAQGAAPVYADGKPVPAEVVRDAYPVTIGPGRYAFSLTDPAAGAPEFIGAKNGSGLYVLDIDALARRTRGRVPAKPGPNEAAQAFIDSMAQPR